VSNIIRRGIIFTAGTFSNAVLFLFHSRVILEVLDTATEVAGKGPATGALDLLPVGIQLAIGVLQIGLIVYLLGGFENERTKTRMPMR
jgi:hypothetical protein